MKKITKNLDSVMSRLKRTCVAKAIAVVAVATIAMNSFAGGANPVADLQGVDGLKGQNFDYIKTHTTSEGNYDVVMGKKFFLYNEKTGKFLTIGGYWGTHVALADYGKPLCIIMKKESKKEVYFVHNMATKMTEDQGPYIGWNVPAERKPTEDTGVYADKKKKELIIVDVIYGWVLEFVNGDTHNACKLRSYKTRDASNIFNVKWSDEVYLCGVPSSVDAGKTCEAYTTDEIKSKNLTGYDTWRIMTYQQVYDLQKENTENMKNSIDLSFMLKCPGFQRGDNDIKNWHTYNYADGKKDDLNVDFASFGMHKQYYKIAKWDESQFVDNLTETKYEFDERYYAKTKDATGTEDYQRRVSKYFCASITNHRGIVYQDVVVSLPGTYVIECKGYSKTEKAALVAGVLNPNYGTNNEPMMYDGVLNRTMLSQTGNMDAAEQAALHIGEKNMDYAGKAFFESGKFTNSVVVVVPKEAMVAGTATIRLGVMVGNNQEDKHVEGDEWTVFDDFRLLYASKTINADLILDQDRADLQYLLNVDDPLQNKTLRLNKTFELHKWNTFVLPVNLTVEQLRAAFGPNTRLAQLEKLTESGIQFQSVKFDGMADDDIALHAYKPYLIIPEKGRLDNKQVYTAEFVNAGTGAGAQTIKVGIAANHYVIPKVSLSVDDLKKIDQTTWATTVSTSNDGQMQAWGTLARTFGKVNEDVENGYQFDNDGNIIEGRDKLIGSYFFANGKMYHSDSRVRGLRGFSCWFKPVNGKSQNAQFTLDGVTQSGTTALDDIFADGEQPVSRFAQGVYNLNGQLVKQGNSTAGLPSGLYIVNGKKCIVR